MVRLDCRAFASHQKKVCAFNAAQSVGTVIGTGLLLDVGANPVDQSCGRVKG